jgi:hypothetical protein
MTALTRQDLESMGYRVVDGKAIRVGSGTQAADERKPEGSGREAATVSPYRSKWEAERAALLAARKQAGSIADWRYEGIRLKLADGAWYKPDFMVKHNDGSVELEEVKGHWREAARLRWKIAVEQYGDVFNFSLCTMKRGHFVRTEHHRTEHHRTEHHRTEHHRTEHHRTEHHRTEHHRRQA